MKAANSGSALSFIRVENNDLHFLLTTLTGQVLLEADYNNSGYRERYRDAQFPSRFHTDYLLRDLCWALWPVALLQPSLQHLNMHIQEKGAQRWLLENGKPILKVQRIDERLHLSNPRFGYEIDLTPLDESASIDILAPESP